MAVVGGGVLGSGNVLAAIGVEVFASVGVEMLCGDESGMAVVWGGSKGVDGGRLEVSMGEGVVLWIGRLVFGVKWVPFAFCAIATTLSAALTRGASSCSFKSAA